VLQAMQEMARALGVNGTGMILRADQQGARVLNTSRGHIRKEKIARYEDKYYWPPARSSEELPLNE
jgi:homoserine kinase